MQVVKYRHPVQGLGTKAALVVEKRTLLHILFMDGKLHPRTAPKSEQRYMTPLTKNGKPYPLGRAKRLFRHYGRAFGMTKAAQRFLSEA
ncbi:MAG: hypothetical protein AMS21_02000 [Gemmatimonas sp. SG8_38_2]|nr:MAG: hypothetical protein AMS21_02000 [Gemmatimonas sp. SG8_38_2]